MTVKGQLGGVCSPLHHVGLRNGPQIIRIGGKHLYLLCCAASSTGTFSPFKETNMCPEASYARMASGQGQSLIIDGQ